MSKKGDNPMNYAYSFADALRQQFDFNQIFATQRRNLEALSTANQMMIEGAQAISRRNTEILRENMDQALRASRELFNGGSPDVNMTKQAELARDMFETTLSNIRETTEMATKSGFEAFDVLNKRAAESMEEIGQTSPKTAKKK